jgi:ribonucleoside-diphosphate reductase alpha chain/ribonucleoside-triphosphate reductase
MKIEKRSGNLCEFDSNKIKTAIIQAMYDADEVNEEVAEEIASDIESIVINSTDEIYSVDEIQDLVEEGLMETDFKQTAKAYIIYRHNKDSNRTNEREYKLLSKEFLSKYKHRPDPFPTELGAFVYLRTYSRWLPEEGRRERWWETVARAVEHNVGLAPWKDKRDAIKEAELMYDNVYNLRQFPSGRSLWSSSTKTSYERPISQFNCSFAVFDDFEITYDITYLLMLGVGFGFSVEQKYIDQLPKVRGDIKVAHLDYKPVPKEERKESTEYNINKNVMEIIVGDSKSGC